MESIHECLNRLTEELDNNNELAYRNLCDGAQPEDLAPLWAYGAGLRHAIRTIQENCIYGH